MTGLPVACSLAERALIDARLTFRRDARTETLVDDLIAAERECCPFLVPSLTKAPDTLVLEYRREGG